ncbi:MAG: arginase family protein [Thermoplasmatota archaeon]
MSPFADLFEPAGDGWVASSYDPNDRFVADIVRADPGTAATRSGREPTTGRGPTTGPAFGLFGVRFDGAVISRKGASEGPRALRAELAKLKPWTVEGGRFVARVRDFGDVRLPPWEKPPDAKAADEAVRTVHAAAEAGSRAIVAEGFVPVGLGGDHSLGYPFVRGAADSKGPIGVINVDAHLDVRDPSHGLTSGTPFGRLLDEPTILRGGNYVVAGARDFATSPTYGERVIKAGGTILPASELRLDPRKTARAAARIAARGTRGVYVSIDADVVDGPAAMGVSAPGVGGLPAVDVLSFLSTLGREIGTRSTLVGCDIVELAPPLDPAGMTARVAAAAVFSLIASYASVAPNASTTQRRKSSTSPLGRRGSPRTRRGGVRAQGRGGSTTGSSAGRGAR